MRLSPRLARGAALDLRVTAPTTSTRQHGDVPIVTAAATWDQGADGDGALALFLVNRSSEPVEVDIAHTGLTLALTGGVQLVADHEPAVPGPEHAARVIERCLSTVAAPDAGQDGARTTLTLAPESWTAYHGTARR